MCIQSSVRIFVFFYLTKYIYAISSPLQTYQNYTNSVALQANLTDLWWSVDSTAQQIIFEIHFKTRGWIGFGISPAGGMAGADIAIGWIDSSGKFNLEDRFSADAVEPMLDNTTNDWIPLKGREENGWTVLQFRRSLDSCDYMDVPIKSGTNILIYAYSNNDPTWTGGRYSIEYHENRRFTKMIPLQSYSNSPTDEKYSGLDYIEFKISEYQVPASDTTYFCQIFKTPSSIKSRRHAVAYKTMIDPKNYDLVHHVLAYECNAEATFDDNKLPIGLCDDLGSLIEPCAANIALGWAVGGDELIENPDVAGYPMGGDFEIKYYMLQMHYDNPKKITDRIDSTGIRFYFGSQLREYEIGYLTLGTTANVYGIVLPPLADRFIIDSYCPSQVTSRIPTTGITVFGAFPHTHLQGQSVWTKIIRNQTAVQYLFNAESYNFNYQYYNKFVQPIKLNPGDEFATRCVYNTTNKSALTIGGEGTRDEMCLHIFSYYPRMRNLYFCHTVIPTPVWQYLMNTNNSINEDDIKNWLMTLKWDSQMINRWQQLYNQSSRAYIYGLSPGYQFGAMNRLPTYTDFPPVTCRRTETNGSQTNILFTCINIFSFIITLLIVSF